MGVPKVTPVWFTQFGSKINGGGLKDRKVTNKTVKIYENFENPSLCVICLFQKYMLLRPVDAPSELNTEKLFGTNLGQLAS